MFCRYIGLFIIVIGAYSYTPYRNSGMAFRIPFSLPLLYDTNDWALKLEHQGEINGGYRVEGCHNSNADVDDCEGRIPFIRLLVSLFWGRPLLTSLLMLCSVASCYCCPYSSCLILSFSHLYLQHPHLLVAVFLVFCDLFVSLSHLSSTIYPVSLWPYAEPISSVSF